MNWDFFNGFLTGSITTVFVGIALILSLDEKDKSDDDDIHYEPIDDNHIKPT